MRSLLVLSIALCLGLATAAPATDLLKALLKRAEAEAKPEKPEDGGEVMIPTEKEFTALAYLGYSIEWLVKKAEDPEAFIAYLDAEYAKDAEVAAEKRGRGGRGDKAGRGGKGGKGSRIGGDKPKGAKDWESDFERSIKEVGVYKTVLKHVGGMSTMLKHSGAIFAHMVSGPNCKDCPELPEEVMAILPGEEEDKDEPKSAERRQLGSAEEDASSSMEGDNESKEQGKRPQGGKMGGPLPGLLGRPRGGPGGRKGGKGQKSSEEEVDAAFGQEVAASLAKRLLKLLARK